VLPAVHRLTDAHGFRQATRRGRRAASRTLVVHLWADVAAGGAVDGTVDGGPDPTRVGFVVSKAVGNAVVRNRVKRRLRHLAREQLSLLPVAAVLVIRALPRAGSASSAELRADLDRCLEGVRR
jgi:ribonuclease P protein component